MSLIFRGGEVRNSKLKKYNCKVMKIELKVQETLIYHDGPQIFVSQDKIDGLYIRLAVDDTPQYISVAISALRSQELRSDFFIHESTLSVK